MTGRFCLIANPNAGPGPATRVAEPVAALLREAGAEVDVLFSDAITTTHAVAEKAVADDRVVVAVGGDGMVASVAGVVSALGGVLGIVPAGSGNDFARALGIPTDTPGVVDALLHGCPRAVDLIAYDAPGHERCIVECSVYAGMDARNSLLANALEWAPRDRKYEFAAVANLTRYEPDEFELSVDGVRTRHRGASIVIANTPYFGRGARVAPTADATDGILDVVVSAAFGPREWMEILLAVADGHHVDRPDVHVYRGRRIALSGRAADGGPVPAGGDGEQLAPLPIQSTHPAQIEVLPAALRVLVRKASR